MFMFQLEQGTKENARGEGPGAISENGEDYAGMTWNTRRWSSGLRRQRIFLPWEVAAMLVRRLTVLWESFLLRSIAPQSPGRSVLR